MQTLCSIYHEMLVFFFLACVSGDVRDSVLLSMLGFSILLFAEIYALSERMLVGWLTIFLVGNVNLCKSFWSLSREYRICYCGHYERL